MQVSCKSAKLPDFEVDSIVIFTPIAGATISRALKDLDDASNGAVSALRGSEEFTGKERDHAVIVKPSGYKAGRVILVGLGERKDITPDSFRRAPDEVGGAPYATNRVASHDP